MNDFLTFSRQGFKEAQRTLAHNKLNTQKKRWINQMLERKAKGFIKRRLGKQVDLDGKNFAARKKGRGKMLVGRNNRMKVRDQDGNVLMGRNGKAKRRTVGIKQNMRSKATDKYGKIFSPGDKVARYHNDGGSERWDAAKAKRIYGDDQYQQPASKAQAKRLLQLGYKRKFKKGTKKTVLKRPTQKWITANMKNGQAGLIIDLLKGVKKESSWVIKTPKRSFMGASRMEAERLKDYAAQLIMKYQQ